MPLTPQEMIFLTRLRGLLQMQRQSGRVGTPPRHKRKTRWIANSPGFSPVPKLHSVRNLNRTINKGYVWEPLPR